jgi:hypothetical protein
MVRCSVCRALRGLRDQGGWIQKESLVVHLKSDVHARAVNAQKHRESIKRASEDRSEGMDFVTLRSSEAQSAISRHIPTEEEQDLWEQLNSSFDAGVDPDAAAIDERRRLEREADEYDIWNGADFVPECDPDDCTLLLDELEQDDILTEVLQNTRMFPSENFPLTYKMSFLDQI